MSFEPIETGTFANSSSFSESLSKIVGGGKKMSLSNCIVLSIQIFLAGRDICAYLFPKTKIGTTRSAKRITMTSLGGFFTIILRCFSLSKSISTGYQFIGFFQFLRLCFEFRKHNGCTQTLNNWDSR